MPFAGYDDFSDCVSQNSDKEDPEAYCAVIKRQIEGESMKEDVNTPYVDIYSLGDRVSKGDKQGQIIRVAQNEIAVMWDDGEISGEDPEDLEEEKDPVMEYFRNAGVLRGPQFR